MSTYINIVLVLLIPFV